MFEAFPGKDFAGLRCFELVGLAARRLGILHGHENKIKMTWISVLGFT